MLQENRWLAQIMSINEDTPYNSNLTTESEPSDGDSVSSGQVLDINGITIFRLENGILTYYFSVGDNQVTTLLEACGASRKRQLVLHIPAIDFHYPIRGSGLLNNRTTLSGTTTTETFGENDTPMSSITIQFNGIPQGWYGTDHWVHYQVTSNEQVQIQEDNTVSIPSSGLSETSLGGFTLKAEEWTAMLVEIPISQRTNPSTTHVCYLTNENGQLTGTIAQDFLKDNLFPFLSLVFGQTITFNSTNSIIGYKDGVELWVRTSRQSEPPLKTRGDNWFLKNRGRIDLSPLFQRFYDLAPKTKNHWRKIIYQYASSEEIIGTLKRNALAASISFAALEGLTRSIISTYPCKNEWLKKDLSLKRGKSIIPAIDMVANQEFGRYSKTFKEASEQIYEIRNATFHTDLLSDEDPANAYYRWQASQALVELLLLRQMGMDLGEIQNRTRHPKFEIMGYDMFEDVRKEELTFEF